MSLVTNHLLAHFIWFELLDCIYGINHPSTFGPFNYDTIAVGTLSLYNVNLWMFTLKKKQFLVILIPTFHTR